MNTKNIIYLSGIVIFCKGLLVFNGVNLPKRDGTVIENPIQYGKETMLLGVVIILVTIIVSSVLKKNNDRD